MKVYDNRMKLFSILLLSISIFTFSQTSQPKIHNTKGTAEVNGAGQLQFTLPIAIPPGVKGVEPQMNLVYTSGASNGIAGYAWNISGITSISRSGKDIEKDGEMKGIQMDYSDNYSFNGQRLILKSGEYGKDGAEYVTEKFSNTKFKSIGAIPGQAWQGPEYWEVTFADGTQAWYGATASGNSTARTPLEYNIVKWKDAQGNYITYNYTQDTGTNVAIISSIKWGGNETLGKTHFNEIEFNYNAAATRSLIEQSYVSGISFIQDKLLNSIAVKTNSTQYKKYDITYVSDNTKYQFVDKIQEYNSENQPANPIVFSHKTNLTGNSNTTPSENFPDMVLSGDFRGTHALDFILSKNPLGLSPNGYYLHYGDSTPKHYLGTENVFTNAIPINIKDANGFVSSRQGIVSYSIDSTTKDLTLKYYLIDLTKPSNVNALYLVGTKVIPKNQWDESENSTTSNPYNVYSKKTTIKKLISYDIDGDGVPEVLIEKNNHTSNTWCTNQGLNSGSETLRPPLGDCETYTYDESKYIVIKQQDNSFPFYEFNFDKSANILFGDFNGDGIDDIGRSFTTSSTTISGESVPGNTLQAYNLKKNAQGNLSLFEVFSANYSGLSSQVQIGDFNGDGISDLFVRTNVNNHYIINLNTGKNFSKIPYFNDFNSTESYTADQNGNYSTAKVLDINKDGKSDIINFSTNYNIASGSSASSSYTIKVSENQGYSNGKILFGANQPVTYNTSGPFIFRDIIGLRQNSLNIYSPTSNQNLGRISYYIHYSDLQRSVIDRIEQGGITTLISYEGSYDYKPIKNEQYPLMELENVNSRLVSSIYEGGDQANKSRFKEFRYRGLIINLHNKKTIGFRQMASSLLNARIFPANSILKTHVWSGKETDPLKEGVPVKEWSIRTNDNSKIFPTDISENNTQLLSFKSTTYQVDKLVNGQVVTSVPDADKNKVVTVVLPKTNKAKDFLTGSIAESTVTYGEYYLPAQTISKINTSYAVTTSNYLYYNNPSGVGADYYIGRPKTNAEVVQAYGDSKSSKEEFTYQNNLLKTLKTWNRDNTAFTLDTFTYDGFGNITQKVSGNSIDSQTITEGYEYDPKGRFVVKQTDNLGLQTVTTYNDWGQIKTQTDPFNNTITNTYDSWGKLLTSTSSLAGTTSYQYEIDTQSNITVIQNSPDGNILKKFTNIMDQEYKTSTKAFGQGQFVSRETEFDILGRKIKESEPYYEGQSASQWNIIAYDDSVYPEKITVTSYNGKKIETSVSGLTTTVKELNGYGRTTSKTTDALGNVVSTTDKGGTIQFSYNAAGEQTQAKYAENTVVTKYDSWGRKSEFNDPSNGVYKYEYDGFGRAKKTISPKGQKEFTYNNFGQLITQKEFSTIDAGQTTNKTISFTYNNKGLLTAKSGIIKGQTFSSAFTYDPQGRLLSSVENSNGKVYSQKGITYDNIGRVASYEKELQSTGMITNVQIENAYSTWNGELYQIKDKVTGKALWEIKETNAKGLLLKTKLGAAEINNTYDPNGFLTNVNHSSAVKPGILQLSYSFDAIKNELKSRTTGGDFNITETFDYDDNNRLINWTNPVTGIKPSASRNVYDVKGRITQNDQIGTIKFENSQKIYQPTGMTLNAEGTQNYNGDLIQTITYNENNDPVQINGEKYHVSFGYGLTNSRQRVDIDKLMQAGGGDSELKSVGVWDPNAPVWQRTLTKVYSEDGSFEVIRDQAANQEKHIIYIEGSPYESNIVYLKDFGESNGSYKFLHKDYLGSILAVTDEAGSKLEQRHYDAWGNFTHLKIGNAPIITEKSIIAESTLLIDRGYTSHEHFMEVGIIHMNGRLYDPLLRRFLNADENIQDPINTQNYNKYGYVMNNPMMYNDPNGEFIAWFVGMLVGSYLSGVQANNGNWNPAKWDWKNTWTSVVGGAFAGAALGQGISNISVYGTKFIQNSVVGSVGGIFNGIASGQNIFKSALIGFTGINYSFNLSGNSITSADGISTGYKKYIISPDYNDGSGDFDLLGGYSPLTKEIYAQYILGRGRGQLKGTDENFLGHMFEKVFIDWARLNIGPNVKDNTIGKNYYGTVPDATSPLAYESNYVPDGVFYEVKNTFRNIGMATAQVKREMNALSINNLTHGIPGGVMVIASPAGVNLTRPLMGYARNLNIDLVHFFSIYKMDGNLMKVRFMTTSTINLFNTAIRLGGTAVPAYKSPN